MAYGTGGSPRALTRAARSAAAADLETVAGEGQGERLRRHLDAQRGRGRCPPGARGGWDARRMRRLLAPSAARAAPRQRIGVNVTPLFDGSDPGGSASWATRAVMGGAATRQALARAAAAPSREAAVYAADCAACPGGLALRLAQHGGHSAKRKLLTKPDRPAAAVACLADSIDYDTQIAVAAYDSSGPPVLARLASEDAWDLLRQVV